MSIGEERGAATAPRVELAGFWRRLGALAIDGLILGAAGWLIGAFFYERLVSIGQFARVIGFAIQLPYLAVLNSRLGGGATLGKRAMGIRVVARDGDGISLPRSSWRAAVFLLPFYLNGFDFSFLGLGGKLALAVVALDVFMVFGVVGATVYLYLANRNTRQVVHDLAAGTFVVREGSAAAIDRHISKIHVVVVVLWLAATAGAALLASQSASPSLKSWFGQTFDADYDTLLAIQSVVNSDPAVLNSNVAVNTTTFKTFGKPATTTSYLVVTATLRRRIDDPEAEVTNIAAKVLEKYPGILNRDRLSVTVRYGYDLGIWSNWNRYSYSYTPDEWLERTGKPSKPSI